MTRAEAVNWIINISADIGKVQHQELWHYEQALAEIRELLEELPSTQKTGKWIPVSERLPEEEGVYPVVINGTEPVLSVKYEQGFAMGYFAPVDEAWEIDGHEESIHDLEVLAWFELPSYEENES